MKAIVSGEAQVAVLMRGRKAYLLKPKESDSTEIDQDLVSRMFQFAKDTETVNVEDEAEARERLQDRIDEQRAWQSMSTLVDPKMPDKFRSTGLEVLRNSRTSTLRCIENRLFAQPLPENVDLDGAVELIRRAPVASNSVLDLLVRLRDRQKAVIRVSRAWSSIVSRVFVTQAHRSTANSCAITTGFLRDLVMADGNLGAIATVRGEQARSCEANSIPGWTKAIEALCDVIQQKTAIVIVARSDEHIRFMKATLTGPDMPPIDVEFVKNKGSFERLQSNRRRFDLVFQQALFSVRDDRRCSLPEAHRSVAQLRGRGGEVRLLHEMRMPSRDDVIDIHSESAVEQILRLVQSHSSAS